MKLNKTTILLEVTTSEKMQLKILAQKNKTSLSNYIRTKALGYERET